MLTSFFYFFFYLFFFACPLRQCSDQNCCLKVKQNVQVEYYCFCYTSPLDMRTLLDFYKHFFILNYYSPNRQYREKERREKEKLGRKLRRGREKQRRRGIERERETLKTKQAKKTKTAGKPQRQPTYAYVAVNNKY